MFFFLLFYLTTDATLPRTMNKRKSARLNGPPLKTTRNGNYDEEDEQSPPIFNLIDDCYYALFNWMPYKDLRSFGQTCKWAKGLAADYYKMKYSARLCVVKKSNMLTGDDIFDLENAQYISINTRFIGPYRHVNSYCNNFIKQIHFDRIILSANKINYLKKILRNVEGVTFTNCIINGDFYESFLKYCSNIKKLCFSYKYKKRLKIKAKIEPHQFVSYLSA